jgi:hypothetical protein
MSKTRHHTSVLNLPTPLTAPMIPQPMERESYWVVWLNDEEEEGEG